MVRSIPKWIGEKAVPETRATTIQLLKSLAENLDEYERIIPLFKELDKPLPTHVFIGQAKDIAVHLGTIIDEIKLQKTRNDYIWVGKPKFELGHLNVKIASLLHQYFDSPTYKIKGKHPPVTQQQIDEAKRKEQADESPCPDDLPGKPCKEEEVIG